MPIDTATPPMDPVLSRAQESGRPITIGAAVWVGGGAILCPGVTIGARSVIGAGSVVTRDVPEDVFAAGNPSRVIRTIAEASDREPAQCIRRVIGPGTTATRWA